MTPLQFLETIKPMVQADMRTSGILSSLTAAQALIESKHGTSGLGAAPNYNLFGIKGEYHGQSVILPTKEWNGSGYVTINAKFRKYPSWQESINDHSAMFNRMPRYSNLRGLTDYKKACQRVWEDGYATAPNYPQTLMNTIKTYHLYDWDAEVLGGSSTAPSTEPVNGNPYCEPTKNVRLNSKGNDVRWVQYQLNLFGYKLIVNGVADNLTIGAVLDFQKRAFPDDPKEWDGIVGPATRAKLSQI